MKTSSFIIRTLVLLSCMSLFSTVTIITAQQPEKNDQENIHDGFSGFRPIDPISYNYSIGWYYSKRLDTTTDFDPDVTYWDDTCRYARANSGVYFSDLDNNDILGLLPNENVGVFIKDVTNKAEASFATATTSLKNHSYEITLDYGKYVTIPIKENTQENSKIIAYARVGVGLRINATIKSSTKNVNLGDIFAIGVAASREKMTGSMAMSIHGVSSKEITGLLPLPSSINSNSIQSAISAIATVKSKIHDEGVVLTPQIISIRSVDDAVSDQKLIRNTTLALEKHFGSNLIYTNQEIYRLAPHLFNCNKDYKK